MKKLGFILSLFLSFSAFAQDDQPFSEKPNAPYVIEQIKEKLAATLGEATAEFFDQAVAAHKDFINATAGIYLIDNSTMLAFKKFYSEALGTENEKLAEEDIKNIEMLFYDVKNKKLVKKFFDTDVDLNALLTVIELSLRERVTGSDLELHQDALDSRATSFFNQIRKDVKLVPLDQKLCIQTVSASSCPPLAIANIKK